ncbi:SHOCT domain-containing protein [Nostocales cyanobacterium LEGE 12452]|nr:SHOCT domain-containing protein [Nostocales cyanobacterium LEGE 12452]
MSIRLDNNKLNPYNPFISTQRDITRTNELAAKNPALAGVLTFIFIPAGLLYLNRVINFLKVFGYFLALSFLVSLVTKSGEDSKGISNFISLITAGTITTEQVMTVNKARQRLKEKSTLVSVDNGQINNKYSSFETNKDAVNLLKELKVKYEANEISEEEFKLQKQTIFKSL